MWCIKENVEYWLKFLWQEIQICYFLNISVCNKNQFDNVSKLLKKTIWTIPNTYALVGLTCFIKTTPWTGPTEKSVTKHMTFNDKKRVMYFSYIEGYLEVFPSCHSCRISLSCSLCWMELDLFLNIPRIIYWSQSSEGGGGG